MSEHGRSKAASRPRYYCDRCDKYFSSVLDFEEHNRTDHKADQRVADAGAV